MDLAEENDVVQAFPAQSATGGGVRRSNGLDIMSRGAILYGRELARPLRALASCWADSKDRDGGTR